MSMNEVQYFAFNIKHSLVIPTVVYENNLLSNVAKGFSPGELQVVVANSDGGKSILPVLTAVAEFMNLGYIPSERLIAAMRSLSTEDLTKFMRDSIAVINHSIGNHRKHKPMYPNFPQQVMEASEVELFFNAIVHYITLGEWMPSYAKLPRGKEFDGNTLKKIDWMDDEKFNSMFTSIVASADSIPTIQKEAVKWFITNRGDKFKLPVTGFPFKENMCLVAANLLEQGRSIEGIATTATDVLRIATVLSGGDVSLAENTKFRNFKRSERRLLVNELERVASAEDLLRHPGKWVRLFHQLHVGDYSQKLYELAKIVREHVKVVTFNSKVEAFLQSGEFGKAVELLSSRPGEFARRLCDILRKTKGAQQKTVLNAFAVVVDQVPTRVLTQLWGATKLHHQDRKEIFVMPKGSLAKTVKVTRDLVGLNKDLVSAIQQIISTSLVQRFKELDNLGKVYIDPQLYKSPIPSGLRSASENARTVARGTRFSLPDDKSTIRLFCWWKGEDIDLSAALYDENFNYIRSIGYYNLRDGWGCHSGDITHAPNGASEFIDVNVAKAGTEGRYLAMTLNVFRGPTFAEHEECFAGWMLRAKPNSNEIYHPKTVVDKVTISAQSRQGIPVVFDLQTREVIWVDVSGNADHYQYGNAHTERATNSDKIRMFAEYPDTRMTLGELFQLHTAARGTVVATCEEADFVFSMTEGDITPFDLLEINETYLK